ncbi:helix-turn-helix transcriptional regulator [Phascolarctobacterium faecium]|uniref:helix-turn-helix domain-containing protein n=1 Tax=Phascolarctobacterium faecium TaxID=33025 RepID=UPI002E8DDE4A|nr:helix-turn-helix transcriptional regulator [Phascolarctobacterium faecium]
MFGDTLRELRLSKKLTQEETAKIIGVARGTYTHYELNKREPDNDTLLKIANLFGVTTDYLLGHTNSIEAKKTPKDLAKFLENTEVMFDGEVHHLDEEDKQKLKNALEFVFWQAKEKNKRKKQ